MSSQTVNGNISGRRAQIQKKSVKNKRKEIYSQSPINGNLALKPESAAKKNAYKISARIKTPSKKRPFLKHTASDKGLHSNFGIGFVTIMCIATGFIFTSLINYVSLRAELFQKTKKIASLSSCLSNTIIENDIFEQNIENNIDYDYIYSVATKELGMIYPSKQQIIYYFHAESEYVEQYRNIK